MGNAEHRTQNAECKTQNTERRTQNEKNFDVLSSEFDVLSSCRLCPRACGADRLAGQPRLLSAGVLPRVFRYGAHFGEEPPITGTRGSGTVFFRTARCAASTARIIRGAKLTWR